MVRCQGQAAETVRAYCECIASLFTCSRGTLQPELHYRGLCCSAHLYLCAAPYPVLDSLPAPYFDSFAFFLGQLVKTQFKLEPVSSALVLLAAMQTRPPPPGCPPPAPLTAAQQKELAAGSIAFARQVAARFVPALVALTRALVTAPASSPDRRERLLDACAHLFEVWGELLDKVADARSTFHNDDEETQQVQAVDTLRAPLTELAAFLLGLTQSAAASPSPPTAGGAGAPPAPNALLAAIGEALSDADDDLREGGLERVTGAASAAAAAAPPPDGAGAGEDDFEAPAPAALSFGGVLGRAVRHRGSSSGQAAGGVEWDERVSAAFDLIGRVAEAYPTAMLDMLTKGVGVVLERATAATTAASPTHPLSLADANDACIVLQLLAGHLSTLFYDWVSIAPDAGTDAADATADSRLASLGVHMPFAALAKPLGTHQRFVTGAIGVKARAFVAAVLRQTLGLVQAALAQLRASAGAGAGWGPVAHVARVARLGLLCLDAYSPLLSGYTAFGRPLPLSPRPSPSAVSGSGADAQKAGACKMGRTPLPSHHVEGAKWREQYHTGLANSKARRFTYCTRVAPWFLSLSRSSGRGRVSGVVGFGPFPVSPQAGRAVDRTDVALEVTKRWSRKPKEHSLPPRDVRLVRFLPLSAYTRTATAQGASTLRTPRRGGSTQK